MDKQKFIDAEKKYDELKARLNHGMITPAQMKSELKSLMILDDKERYWMIGSKTGKWYIYENKAWVESDPPHQNQKSMGILDEDSASVPSYQSMIADSDSESVATTPKATLTPDDSSIIEIKSVQISSLILFFGGIGIIAGIITGAVFGIFTDLFPESAGFMPEMLKGIRGKVQGGIIFSIIGMVSGFLLTTVISLVTGFLFNFLSGFFGGVKFKIRN